MVKLTILVIILILIMGTLFGFLYFSGIMNSRANEVPTNPNLSGLEAAEVVASDLKEKIGNNYDGFHVYTNIGFLSYDDIQIIGRGNFSAGMLRDFDRRGINLEEPLTFRLFYMHQNGTMFNIDSAKKTIEGTCSPQETCVPSKEYTNYTLGKLVYLFDISVDAVDGRSWPENYMIDAMNGEVLYSLASKRPSGIPSEILQKYYVESTS